MMMCDTMIYHAMHYDGGDDDDGVAGSRMVRVMTMMMRLCDFIVMVIIAATITIFSSQFSKLRKVLATTCLVKQCAAIELQPRLLQPRLLQPRLLQCTTAILPLPQDLDLNEDAEDVLPGLMVLACWPVETCFPVFVQLLAVEYHFPLSV